jgi:hypothetical protein
MATSLSYIVLLCFYDILNQKSIMQYGLVAQRLLGGEECTMHEDEGRKDVIDVL